MITFDKNNNSANSWFWKKIKPGEFTTFSISSDSCMKIFNIEGSEVEKLLLGYDKNRLTFDGDDSANIYLIATIRDFSNLPSGIYKYEINVQSLVDSLNVKDSGEMEIISE